MATLSLSEGKRTLYACSICSRLCMTRYVQSSTSLPSGTLKKTLVPLPRHCPHLMVSQQAFNKLQSPLVGSAWEKISISYCFLWQESLNSSGFHRLFSYISAPSWPAEAMLAAPHTAESTSSPKLPYSCWKAKQDALALGGGPGASCVRQQPRIMYIWAKFFAAALGWIQSQVKLLLLFPGETEADFALWVKLFQMIWQIHFVLPSV